jgi:hypothetical protein
MTKTARNPVAKERAMTDTDARDAPRMETAAPGKARVRDPLVPLFHCSAETLPLAVVAGDKRAPGPNDVA